MKSIFSHHTVKFLSSTETTEDWKHLSISSMRLVSFTTAWIKASNTSELCKTRCALVIMLSPLEISIQTCYPLPNFCSFNLELLCNLKIHTLPLLERLFCCPVWCFIDVASEKKSGCILCTIAYLGLRDLPSLIPCLWNREKQRDREKDVWDYSIMSFEPGITGFITHVVTTCLPLRGGHLIHAHTLSLMGFICFGSFILSIK